MIILALVGVGGWGKNYLQIAEKISSCRIKYICSTSNSKLKVLPNKYIKLTNYKKLLLREDIDGVIIASSASTHYRIAKDFLERGFNLLIEKPLVISLTEAISLKKTYNLSNKIVLVGHVFQYHPAYVKAKQLAKTIGELKYIDSEGMDFGPFRSDVSALWDWAPHDVAMCQDIVGESPIQVTAKSLSILRPNTRYYDNVDILLTFSRDISARIKIGWLGLTKKRSLTVIGSKGIVQFNDLSDNKISYVKKLNSSIIGVSRDDVRDIVEYPKYSTARPLDMQLLDFVNCIAQHKSPRVRFNQAFEVIKTLYFIEKSIKQDGKTIKVVAN